MLRKCPGSQNFSQPKPEYIKCMNCGSEIEIWTDEVKVNCSYCSSVNTRDSDECCLDWCKFAKDCVGIELYNKWLQNKKKK